MANEIDILIADDHPIFRQGLRQLIGKESGIKVVAEACDGEMAFDLVKTHVPSVAVLDLDMPTIDGFAVAANVQKLKLPVKIVILSMHKDELHFNQAIDQGIDGYVIKDGAVHEIINCIKTVASGQKYFSPKLSSFLFNKLNRISEANRKFGLSDLTPTERRVLYLLSDLKTSRHIAAELGVSPRTVENHRAHICSKLNLQGAHALVKFALEHKRELQ